MLVWAETFWEEERDEETQLDAELSIGKHLQSHFLGTVGTQGPARWKARHTPNREGLPREERWQALEGTRVDATA